MLIKNICLIFNTSDILSITNQAALVHHSPKLCCYIVVSGSAVAAGSNMPLSMLE